MIGSMAFTAMIDPIEIINVRLIASAALTRMAQPKAVKVKSSRPKPFAYRRVWFTRARPVKTPIYDRAALRPGQTIAGPAIFEQFEFDHGALSGGPARVLTMLAISS